MKKIEIESMLKTFMLVQVRFSVKLTSGEVLDTVTLKTRHDSDSFYAVKLYLDNDELWEETFDLKLDEIEGIFNVRPPLAVTLDNRTNCLVSAKVDNEEIGIIALSERYSKNQLDGYTSF